MNIPYVFKRCTKCGEWLVACKVNFYKHKGGKYGLSGQCKQCKKTYTEQNEEHIKEYRKQWYEQNKEEVLEKCKKYRETHKKEKAETDKKYREANKEKIAKLNKEYYENNKEKIKEYHKQWYENNKYKLAKLHKEYYENNKEKLFEYHKQYRKENKEKLFEYHKQYRKENKEKLSKQRKERYENNKELMLERSKKYREKNREKLLESKKQWYRTPQGQAYHSNADAKRRLKKQNQGNGITKYQWLEMMKYFEFRCAYSGEVLNENTRSIDHIEPLNQGGEHEIWNVVPMYRSYNLSKHDKDMLQWYKEQPYYSEDRLQKIYEWQEYAYNKWHKEEII